MENVISGENTFTYYLDEYNKNNHTAEILKPQADKYKDRLVNLVSNSILLFSNSSLTSLQYPQVFIV